MVNDIAVQDFVNAIKETPTDTNTTYQATVSRIDDEGVVWVNIHGSEKETPTASTSSEVKRGDNVTVQWRNNKLYIAGNYSNPSAGVSTVNTALQDAILARLLAETAENIANEAGMVANSAMISANGKNTIYRQSTQPTGGNYVNGDVWFDTANDNQIHRFDGTSWVAVTLGDDALASLSADKITAGTIDCTEGITVTNIDAANITTGNLGADRMKVNSISAINDNEGTVKINANKVEITGTAVFNAVSSDATASAAMLNSNIEVGGTNLYRNTRTYEGYTLTAESGTAVTAIENEPTYILNFPATTTGGSSGLVYKAASMKTRIPYSSFRNKDVVFSMKTKAASGATYGYILTLDLYAYKETGTGSRIGTYSRTDKFTGTGNWESYVEPWTMTDNKWRNVTGSPDFENCYVNLVLFNKYDDNSCTSAFQVKELKLEVGNVATDWSPAPEDLQSDIDAAQSTANGANAEEQVIYKQAVSGTNSMSGTTTWVTATGESVSADTAGLTPVWTTKRPTYRSKYPVLFVATQRKTVGGTVTCTTPLKDDTVTIIDGGHITTGTIDASVATITNINGQNITAGTVNAGAIKADSGTFATALIPDLSAGKITSGTIDANVVNIQNLTIGSAQSGWSGVLNDNVQIGGRNLLLATDDYISTNGSSKGFSFTESIDAGQQLTLSVDIDADNIVWTSSGSNHRFGMEFNNPKATSGTQYMGCWARKAGESGSDIVATIDGTSFHGRISNTVTPETAISLPKSCYIYITGLSSGTVKVSNPKIEIGNKATDWTPAPEDVEEEISNADTNMLLDWNAPTLTAYKAPANRYFSNASFTWCTATVIDISDPPEPSIKYGARMVGDGTNTSAGNRGMAFYVTENLTNLRLRVGCKYTASVWARKTSGSASISCVARHNGSSWLTVISGKSLTTDWQRYYGVFEYTTAADYNRVIFQAVFSGNTAGTVEMCGFKLVANGDSSEATTYITAIDNNGIKVHAANNVNSNYAKINADGMEVFKDGNSVAQYGDTARIGEQANDHVLVSKEQFGMFNEYDEPYFTITNTGDSQTTENWQGAVVASNATEVLGRFPMKNTTSDVNIWVEDGDSETRAVNGDATVPSITNANVRKTGGYTATLPVNGTEVSGSVVVTCASSSDSPYVTISCKNQVGQSVKIWAVYNQTVDVAELGFAGYNNLLWEGAKQMSETQVIKLSQGVSQQLTGIALVWAKEDGDDWTAINVQYVPKDLVRLNPSHDEEGVWVTTMLTDRGFGDVGTKVVCIDDHTILGSDENAVNQSSGTARSIGPRKSALWDLIYVFGV